MIICLDLQAGYIFKSLECIISCILLHNFSTLKFDRPTLAPSISICFADHRTNFSATLLVTWFPAVSLWLQQLRYGQTNSVQDAVLQHTSCEYQKKLIVKRYYLAWAGFHKE